MHRRRIAAVAGTLAAIAITTATLAGGWATIVPDAEIAPVAGEPIDIGFTVMQHGQTPASWVDPSVVIEEVGSATALTVPAQRAGAAGHFVATVTIPAAGSYTWAVTMADLIVEGKPIAFETVAGPATRPASIATDSAAIDEAMATELAGLRGELTVMRALAIGLAAVLAGVLAGAAAAGMSRRRASARPDSSSPSSEAILGR
jgi:hypothetical protein